MKRDKALEGILERKVIAVIRTPDAARVLDAVEALRQGGVRAVEITMTVPGALDIIQKLAVSRPVGVLVGAGTVLDADTAAAAVWSGADFIVSPLADPGMIAACRAHETLVAPGAFSPAEIVAAWDRGADIVKVFPATSLGPQYLRDVRAPFPQLRLMPTGGVTAENARAFLEAGASAVGLGAALVDKKALAAGDWKTLTERASRLVESLRGL
ncbi:MAG TPA: bifunctional 4-hydroxy-2-oxoglutarate aldolase/2-dehydro-3-deoxy-phosphogluconate aldolase [Terriglobales bacterium]|nr:bifunctional 4-hydroxy-2-oxoglutarate aldolase/2-dehydro-3-deoxy-phosphogluconate aldolase [Terriglobales bacterium]